MSEMNRGITVLIADDHPFLRQGIRAILAGHEMQVIGEADNGEKAVELAKVLCPDLVIMDISMPGLDGLEATRRIMQASTRTRVLMLSMHRSKYYAVEAFRAGALGYVLKEGAPEELIAAVRKVMADKTYVSPALSEELLGEVFGPVRHGEIAPLSKREKEVLKLLADGMGTREVANRLCIALSTVKCHRVNIMKKLDVYDMAGLVKRAITMGLTEVE